MSHLDLILIAAGLGGIALFSLLWRNQFFSNRRTSNTTAPKQPPFLIALLTLLSLAAVVFSIHALLVVHGVLRW